jgi:hypothetical protein
VEGRKGSRVGAVGERKLGDKDLRAEEDSREIGYFDRDGDPSEIQVHGGPDAWPKVREAARLVVCLAAIAGSNQSNQQKIGTAFISQEIRCKISVKKRTPDHTFSVFRSFISKKSLNGPEKSVSRDSKIIYTQGIDGQTG